ncbi:MAG: isochorismatase family protein [Kiloniellales bacterium]
MPGKGPPDFHVLLRPDDTVLLILDYQERFVARLPAGLRESLANSTLALAKLARSCQAPVVLSNVSPRIAADKAADPLKEYLPSEAEQYRSTLNCWEDPALYQGIEGLRRRRLLIAGLWTESAVSFAALSALEIGYDVYAVTDAMAGLTAASHETAIRRLMQAGVVPISWLQLLFEWYRIVSVKQEPAAQALAQLAGEHADLDFEHYALR